MSLITCLSKYPQTISLSTLRLAIVLRIKIVESSRLTSVRWRFRSSRSPSLRKQASDCLSSRTYASFLFSGSSSLNTQTGTGTISEWEDGSPSSFWDLVQWLTIASLGDDEWPFVFCVQSLEFSTKIEFVLFPAVATRSLLLILELIWCSPTTVLYDTCFCCVTSNGYVFPWDDSWLDSSSVWFFSYSAYVHWVAGYPGLRLNKAAKYRKGWVAARFLFQTAQKS